MATNEASAGAKRGTAARWHFSNDPPNQSASRKIALLFLQRRLWRRALRAKSRDAWSVCERQGSRSFCARRPLERKLDGEGRPSTGLRREADRSPERLDDLARDE